MLAERRFHRKGTVRLRLLNGWQYGSFSPRDVCSVGCYNTGVMRVDLTLQFPGALAEQAQAQGLLTPAAIEAMVLAELRRRQVEVVFSRIDELRAANGPGPDLDTVVEDVHTLRKANRDAQNRR